MHMSSYMSVAVLASGIASWTRARSDHWWNPLAAATRTFINSSPASSAMEYEDVAIGVGIQSRKLSDAAAAVSAGVSACGAEDTSWKGRINGILMSKAYGSVFLNMIADVMVRFIFAFVVPLLAFGYFQRARSRKQKFTDQQLKQLSAVLEERDRALWHPNSDFRRLLETITSAASQGQDSTADHGLQGGSNGNGQHSSDGGVSLASTSVASKPVKSVPKNGYREMTDLAALDLSLAAHFKHNDEENILRTLQMIPQISMCTASRTGASEPVLSPEKLEKRPVKPDIRCRLNDLLKDLQKGKKTIVEQRGGLISAETSASASSSSFTTPSTVLTSLASTASSGSETLPVQAQPAATACEAGRGRTVGGPEHIVDIPLLAVLRSPAASDLKTGDKLKKFIMSKLGIDDVDDMYSSRILQARMKSTDKNVRSLREIAVEGMKVDPGFTLQIGRFSIFHCTGNPEEPAQLSLEDVEVPIILQAEFVAGVLTIRGQFLEGAEIRAATSNGYMILDPVKKEKLNKKEEIEPQPLGETIVNQEDVHSEVIKPQDEELRPFCEPGVNHNPLRSKELPHAEEIEEWRCSSPSLLLHKPVHIFASKEVPIEDKNITVRSEACRMVDNTLGTVIREWAPATILVIFMLSHVISPFKTAFNFALVLQSRLPWLLYLGLAVTICILRTLPPMPPRLESTIKTMIERVKLAYSTFKIAPIFYSKYSDNWLQKSGLIYRQSRFKVSSRCTKKCSSNFNKHQSNGPISKSSSNSLEKDSKIKTTKQKCGETKKSPSNLDWQWSSFKQIFSGTQNDWISTKTDSTDEEHKNSEPFEVIYRPFDGNKVKNVAFEDLVVDNRPKNIIVKIFSKGLQNILKASLPRYLQVYTNHAEIQAECIFRFYLEGGLERVLVSKLKTNQAPTMEKDDSTTTWLHIFHLIRFIEKEYENIILQYQRMISEGVIAFDMLWTLFQDNEKVVYYCDISKEELCGKVLSCHYSKSDQYERHKQQKFVIELEMWDYDCVNYEPKVIKRKIPEFFQEWNILNLDVHPIKFEDSVFEKEAFFLNRGKRYHELVLKTERHFLQYKGIMFWSFDRTGPVLHHRESMDGRVMIDQSSYAKMKSKRYMGTAQPAKGWLQGCLERDKSLPSDSDPNLQFAPTIVYGFSFSLRKWGCFLIPELRTITFNSTVLDTLVMKDEQSKVMLLAMTHYYLQKPTPECPTKIKDLSVDPLSNKGKGCIILLHGPPGTGKTFTVEALAEKMGCPLWQLTVSTLNMKPKKLETRLVKKFEVATLWGAILLLDEADVYLSSRKYSPLATDASQGNALTGVFLRILEYYKGVLFLTTNQIDSFEPAIYSRISLFIKYEEFNFSQRRQLWSNFLERVGISDASPTFWSEVLPMQLNARVIRNIVCNAEILCASQGKELHEDHVLYALRVMSLAATSGLITTDHKTDQRDVNQDSVSVSVPSIVAHDQWSVSDVHLI